MIAVLVLSACLSIEQVSAQTPDILQELLKTEVTKYLDDPQMQLNLIKNFIKGMVMGEIRLYDLAINQSTKMGTEHADKVLKEVNGFVSILFHEKYANLKELVKDIKKTDPNALQG